MDVLDLRCEENEPKSNGSSEYFKVMNEIISEWNFVEKNQCSKDCSLFFRLFGIPIVLDETPSQDVIDFLFAQCTGNHTELDTNDEFEIDDNALKAYLSFVSGIPTEFDSEAMAMLKYYFIVTRAIRPSNSVDCVSNATFKP